MKTKITKDVMKYALGVFLTVTSLSFTAQGQSVTIVPSGPIVCAGTKLDAVVTGLNGPLTYLWSNGATTSSIFISQSNFYRVRVTGFVGGSQVTVRSNWTPFLVIPATNATINPTGPVNVCPGQSATLFGSGGQFFSSYTWSTGANTRNITVNQSGTYTLTVTNSFGSCNNSSTASVDVNVFDPGYQPLITPLSPLTVCQPGFVDLEGAAGFSSYSWSNGATTQNVSVLMDGTGTSPILDTLTMSLTVSINNGQCSFTNPGVVLRSVRQPELITTFCGNLSLTPSDSIKAGLVLTYLSAPQYEFEFEETTNPGNTFTYISNNRWCNLANVSPAVQVNKFYIVRVRAVIGGTPYCYGDPCIIGIVAPTPSNKTAFDVMNGNGFTSAVFPNPSSESFNLVLRGFNEDQTIDVRVTDVTGRVVSTFTYDTHAGSYQFGKELTNGIYMVNAQQGDQQTVSRIVKTN